MSVRTQRARPGFKVAHVALLLPWIMAVVAARLPIRDNSFLWHVAAGRLQVDRGSVLTSDPFSFTFGGEAWRTQSWLLELGYGIADTAAGLAFVPAFVATVGAIMFGFLLLTTYRVTQSVPATAVVGVMSSWVSAAFISPRPVLVSFALLAIVAASLHEERLRWTLPLVGWVWAAMHGSFILGIGLVVLAALWQRRPSRLIDAAAMVVASTFTAHGIGIWQILIEFAFNQEALALITEWATPDLTRVALLPLLIGIVLLLVVGAQGRLPLRSLWLVAPFLVFAFTATRAVLPAWIVIAPYVGLAMARMPTGSPTRPREQRVLTAVTVVLLVVPFALPIKDASQLSPTFPIEAATYLSAASVFHDDFAGGYLIYRYGTERPVYIDDRAELYGAEHLRSMIQARNGVPEWRDAFDEWGIEQALLSPKNGLARVLTEEGWSPVFETEEFVVFERPDLHSG